MTIIFEYLIKVSISLGVVYLFYHFLLRRLTFYSANRWYLLLYSFCSFLIPLINVSPVLQRNQLEGSSIVNYIPVVSTTIAIHNPGFSNTIPYEDARLVGQGFLIILLTGGFAMLVRLFIQYLSYVKVKRSSTLLFSEPIRIFHVNDPIIPFSIGNSIFINRHLHNEEELKEIIRHEFIHVKQKHSVDIFLSELLCVFNWYNPFAWMIRRAIKVNLEFIADDKVLASGVDRKEYQCLLLKVIGVSPFSITNQFNFSSLKKRIAMMNKKQSAKAQLLKLLLLLPVIIIVLLAFRTAGRNIQWNIYQHDNYISQDTIPAPPPPPPKPELPANLTEGKEYDEFLNRNPSVKSANLKNGLLVVVLKSGATDTYDLSNNARFAAAEKKYGKLPLMPPPPPPPPKLPKDVKSVNVNDQRATVVFLNGNKEEYDLTKPEEREAFDKKYHAFQDPESMRRMKEDMERMELKMYKEEMMKRMDEHARDLEMQSMTLEDELRKEKFLREHELRGLSQDRQRELELFQKKLEKEAEQNQQSRDLLLENAAKNGENVDKLRRRFELEKTKEIEMRNLELMKVKKERELEMELVEKRMELESRTDRELKEVQLDDMKKQLYELQERNELMQNKIQGDSKKLSVENKKEVISQLEMEKKELLKTMQELKSKQAELDKRIQDLKKKDH